MKPASRGLLAVVLVAGAVAIGSAAALAGSDAAQLPPNWHSHDCNNPAVATEPACGFDANGDWHLGIAFFPAILGISAADYAEDPARCPNATDKAFLPQGKQDNQPLRAGHCETSDSIIHLHTVLQGESGPEGWSLAPGTETVSGAVYVTYYRVNER
jgi:hypothetical protein